MKKHLFILDPLEKLNFALDSSIRMAFELSLLGHKIYTAQSLGLYWKGSEKDAAVTPKEATFSGSPESIKLAPLKKTSLRTFDAIHMRKDPPYDMNYIADTWFLQSVEDKVRIYNSPRGLRAVNEKMGILLFPEDIDPTIVSADVDELFAFYKNECAGDAVLKPLTMHGGKGVERMQQESTTDDAAKTKLTTLTNQGQSAWMLQKFNPAVFTGELRCFTVFGKAISWCIKKPKAGEFLANSYFGSTRHQYTPKPAELETAERAAKLLLEEHGISIIGFDMIGGKLSEINVTSPRLLQAPDDQTNYYAQFAKLVAADLS